MAVTSNPCTGERGPAGGRGWRVVLFPLVTILLLLAVRAGAQDPTAHPANHQGVNGEESGFFQHFLKVYTPRKQCMDNEQILVWLHAVADLMIAASYYSIPFALVAMVRKRKDFRFNWIFYMFAGFILACGTTHLFNILALWHPLYKLDGLVKLFTGIISAVAAVILWPLVPKVLALPSRASLQSEVQARTAELQAANTALTRAMQEQERAQNALQQSEARFRGIFEGAATGIVTLDSELRFVQCNPAFSSIVGYSDEELGCLHLSDLVHPEDQESNVFALQRLAAGEVARFEIEHRYVHKQGQPVWVQKHISLVRDAHGMPLQYLAQVTDVSERREAEEALRRSEERFQIAVRATNDAVWDWALPTNALWWSDGVRTLFGYPVEQIPPIISWWYDHVHPEDRERVVSGIHAVVDGSEAFWRDEYRFLRADNSYAVVFDRGYVIREEGGKAVRMLGAMQDITESRRVAQALTESEARFRAAVGAVSSLLWTNNARGQMDGLQPGWTNFTGQTYEEYQGYGWSKAVHPEDAQQTIDAWNKAVAEKRLFEFEHRLRRRDGQWRLCSIRAVPVLDKLGEIREWVGVHTDITEQRRAEEASRESEERYRVFIANSSEGVWRIEFEPPIDTRLPVAEQVDLAYRYGRMAECNDAMARMFGLRSAQDLLGKSLDFMLPAGDTDAREFLAFMIQAGYRVTDVESAERDVAENLVYFSRSMAGVVVKDRLLRIWGTQRDITRRKQAEDALRLERERLSLALGAGRMGVYDLNLRENKLWWSPEIYAVFGVSPADFVPSRQSFTSLVHPEDREALWQSLDHSISEGQNFHYEFRIIRPDGVLRWIANRALTEKDSNGLSLRHYGIALDITERKRAEEALRENEAVLRTVTSEAHVGLVMVDKNRRYLFANHTYSEILGITDPSIVGKGVPDVLPNVYNQIQPRLDLAFAGERVTYELHVPVHPKTSGERFYEVVYEPRVANTPEPYVVVVIVDITERKRMQHTLERLVEERTARLRETIEELEAFSYSIAHDMRAPLRAMQGFSHLLQEEYGPQIGQGKDYLRRIASSANRLDALIQDVLNYSKIVRAELPLESVNTADFLTEIVESYPNLQPPHADIEIRKPMPPVRANPAALTQVFSNILGNAVKFVAPGVKPKVFVWAETTPEGIVRIWFEDNGIGIRKEVQNRIFHMFQRLNPPGQYEGTGIGLTIVRKAVEKMGGRIGLESELGKGSVFWIELKQPA